MNDSVKYDYDGALIQELRLMAREGASTQDLAQKVCAKLGLSQEAFVPIFAYLRRAFCVPLKTILPLQEGFAGPYARVAQTAIRFSSEILGRLESADTTPWNWDQFRDRFPHFDPADLQIKWNVGENSQVALCITKYRPVALYARGYVTETVDKAGPDLGNDSRLTAVREFAFQFTDAIFQTCESREWVTIGPVFLGFDFQVQEIGPIFKLVCLVQALVDVSVVAMAAH